MPSQALASAPGHRSGHVLAHSTQTLIESLVDETETESRLLDELIAIMGRQREAVQADDMQAVDDSVFATHRVLATLAEARRRHETLSRLLGNREDLALRSLNEALGARLTRELTAARTRRAAAAATLSSAVSANRRLLRAALTHEPQP